MAQLVDAGAKALNPLPPRHRLMEAAVWAAARWAATYLLSEEAGLPPSLGAAFGAQGGGPAIAGFLVQASLALLVGWPGARVIKGGRLGFGEMISFRVVQAPGGDEQICLSKLEGGNVRGECGQ